jgi:hypothetical protein
LVLDDCGTFIAALEHSFLRGCGLRDFVLEEIRRGEWVVASNRKEVVSASIVVVPRARD